MATTTTNAMGEQERQFYKDARKRGYREFSEFDDVFSFMDFCYQYQLTNANSMCLIKEDGSGCIIAYK